MKTAAEQTLPLFVIPREDCNVDWLVGFLAGRDWTTAREILREIGHKEDEITEDKKRWLRALAAASGGRVCGHQQGYKLAVAMTGEEYAWWRNEWLKSASEIRWRVLRSDRVFYGRKAA